MNNPKSPSPRSQADTTYGFLTIVEDRVAGYLGGYLLVDRRGRPLEFHCTAPIQSSRAEEILFGPTLLPHLFCDRIGAALLEKASLPATLVVVNQVDSWTLGDETSALVVYLPAASPDSKDSDGSVVVVPQLDRIDPSARPEVERQLDDLSRYVHLHEPFERIIEAIREAGQLERNEQPNEGSREGVEVPFDDAA